MANILSNNNIYLSRDTISSGIVVRQKPNFSSDRSASPRLLNWVEPVVIAGYQKSIFYTEIDSNLKVGDRVFIINGNYDSDILIDKDRYKKGRDGYKVLDIDRCKITLDIDYTGVLPWIEDSFDNFIKVYHVRNQREFDYVNKQFIARDSYVNKFTIGQNNIIFVDSGYNGISSILFGSNTGVLANGFYVRDTNSLANWINITTDFLSKSTYFESTILSTNFTNNGRFIVISENITYGDKEFRENDIYFYNLTTNTWEIDPLYTRPFITKSNFRRGNFKGDWNKGLYGSYEEKIIWHGTSSTWTNGSVINTEWRSGTINSTFMPDNSYLSEFDEFGLPVQKENIVNNRGFGYSYFIDMDFKKSTINNGNFINCNIGLTGSTFSVADKFYQGSANLWSSELDNIILGGDYTSCELESVDFSNSVIKNSRTNNTYFNNSTSINSHFNNVVFNKSNYNSDNIIKILGYDEFNAHLNNTSAKSKIYKFYISESDYLRMKSLDKFHIKGLRINSNDNWTLEYNDILNFFDRGFILDSYSDYEDAVVNSIFIKSKLEFTCKLSTTAENTYKLGSYYIGGTYSTDTYLLNDTKLPSIDIIVNIQQNANDFFTKNDYNYTFVDANSTATSSISSVLISSYIGDWVDISNAFIVDSDFSSGLFISSNWNSGDLYNYNLDNQIMGSGNFGLYNISVSGTQLIVQISATQGVNDNYFKVGDVVYLNAIDYNNQISVTRLPNTWKIDNIIGSNVYLNEYLIGTTSTMVTSLTGSGIFLTSPDGLTSSILGTNRYNYLHKVRFNSSNIRSGIIRRPFISSSTIFSKAFDNSDYNFTDKESLKQLMLMDSIFSNNKNSIKSGLITNSYLNEGNDIWYNGILWRSIWESGNFNNGVVRESNWKSGNFNNGIFTLNKTSLLNTSFFTDYESSYYKSGTTVQNDRFTWLSGNFKNGEFFDSVWESGDFSYGKIYKSTWVSGLFNEGIFGDDRFNLTDNNFYGGTFSNGLVINSNFYSGGTYSLGFNGINWQNGVFQSGIFGNNINDPQSTATWDNGVFNGGSFKDTAVWKNGTFNGGKLISYYGLTYAISNTQSQYTWQNGIFNGGEFGTGDGLTNSTWWDGEMYGGVFKGKVWNNGLLSSGEFQGGSTWSSVGPITGTSSTTYKSNAISFVDSFSYSYYGLWRNGLLTETKDKLSSTAVRSSDDTSFEVRVNKKRVTMNNALWLGGTFSHKNGVINNSIWLDGTFQEGTFKNSSFNPYVKRDINSLTHSFNLNDDTCVWENGIFDGGDFNISVWENGTFIIGTATGMIWKNGTSNYMNAFNIFWENGLWRNGNWYGSSFEFNGSVTDDYIRQILFRGMSWSGTSSCHVWNIFENPTGAILVADDVASEPQAPPPLFSVLPGGGGGGGGDLYPGP